MFLALNLKRNKLLKRKYFAFTGVMPKPFVLIGEFLSINDAMTAAEEKEIVYFYLTSEKEWKEMIGTFEK